MHDTSAALGGIATYVCTGKTELLPEKFDQHGSAFDLSADCASIHDHRNVRHSVYSSIFDISVLALATASGAFRAFRIARQTFIGDIGIATSVTPSGERA